MRHDRDPGGNHRLNVRDKMRAALHFDRVRAALFHEPDPGADRLLGGLLIAAKWQIGNDQRLCGPARNGPGEENHLLHRDRERGGEAEDVIARRVANQEHLHAGLIENLCRQGVIRGQHGKVLAGILGRLQVGYPYARTVRQRNLLRGAAAIGRSGFGGVRLWGAHTFNPNP